MLVDGYSGGGAAPEGAVCLKLEREPFQKVMSTFSGQLLTKLEKQYGLHEGELTRAHGQWGDILEFVRIWVVIIIWEHTDTLRM